MAARPYSSVNFLYISADRHLWAADDRNSKIVEYDLKGITCTVGAALSDNPGGLFNTHGMSVDQDGNFYVAEVGNGRAQKFSSAPGADPQNSSASRSTQPGNSILRQGATGMVKMGLSSRTQRAFCAPDGVAG